MPAKKRAGKGVSTKLPQSPSQIAPGVFVGNWDDAVKFEGSRFCVLDEAPAEMPPSTHVRIYDEEKDRADSKALDRVAASMKAAHDAGKPVLVYCGQGIYRSPLAAAWYLKRTEGVSIQEAYKRVLAVRPKAKPAATWLGNYSEIDRA